MHRPPSPSLAEIGDRDAADQGPGEPVERRTLLQMGGWSAAGLWLAGGLGGLAAACTGDDETAGDSQGSGTSTSNGTAVLGMSGDPAAIDETLDVRAVTFENTTGGRGAGGTAADGRKGAPSRRILPGERVVLADLEGPGRVNHLWVTVPMAPPEVQRALLVEGFYDGANEPSISVPLFDLFGAPHGRPVAYTSMLSSIQEGRGLNLHVPMPFQQGIRLEFFNGSNVNVDLYYQVDLVLGPTPPSYLHVSWRRENPTTLGRDMVITEGLRGPGRFLGANVGVRVLDDGVWYGEGEVKVYRDGDTTNPTLCGTGLEDYVGSAWGLGAHAATWAGAPLDVRRNPSDLQPDYLGFYRWHVPDPIMFTSDLRVTIQQIGAYTGSPGREFEAYAASHPVAGAGWYLLDGTTVQGIAERVDDYCATAYVYTTTPQAVPRVDLAAAVANVQRTDYEAPSGLETFSQQIVNAERRLIRPRDS